MPGKIHLLKPSINALPLQRHFGAASRREEQELLLSLHHQALKDKKHLFYGSFYLIFSPTLLQGVFSVCSSCLQQWKSTARGSILVSWLQEVSVLGRVLPVEPPWLMQESRPCSSWSEKCCCLLMTCLAQGWLLEKAKSWEAELPIPPKPPSIPVSCNNTPHYVPPMWRKT